jgi:hypothetical protein
MTTLMEQEKQRISERLARLDAEREKLSGQLNELEIAERVLARFAGKAVTTEKRRRERPAITTPAAAGERGGRSSQKAPGVSISDASLKAVQAHSRGRHPRQTPQLSLPGIRDDGPAESPWRRAATSPPCRPARKPRSALVPAVLNLNRRLSHGGPRVRIHLPPAASRRPEPPKTPRGSDAKRR